ncbi:BCCT family transporter [Streptomyces sp. LHD-70]|uniref:BCCT family transporter n=1 Tax=Streptomyces sp. LHD-70 TaxID=3072140 RepID=UPI0028103E4B|nr:BCCT family transporter [Streptomyces sp. LHD-70]MDQ8704002.1 BCCT family transporter [Streptomyces sp. LHD-70]
MSNATTEKKSADGARSDPAVLYLSVTLAALFVAWGVFFTDNLARVADATLGRIIENFGWLFVLAIAGFVLLAVSLALSRFGDIRLGKDHERPEFRTASWVAMMFSAGMGIGLMFYGASEPVMHVSSPPPGTAEAGTQEAARVALEYSYFHWAIHPWALYGVAGLVLAYFGFRKGGSNLISCAFRPLIGDRVDGPLGKSIDILAIFATLFGSAVSLGLGAMQINSGLNAVWGIGSSTALAVSVIAVLTVLFVLSALSGVHRGIQWLSNGNMVLAGVLLAFVFVAGPTVFILNSQTEALGGYLASLPEMSFRTGAFGGGEWLSGWTVFYWAWWISWTPFVGMFIARISRGRTIRQFIFGVILAPSLVSVVWFAILGGTAMNQELHGGGLSEAVAAGEEAGLFATLANLPWFPVTSVVVIILVGLFFVSGADAASLVLATLSCRGSANPSRVVVILWGALTGLVAAVLLLAGGLEAVKQVAVIAAFPFLFVMIGMCVSLVKALRAEPRRERSPEPASAQEGDELPDGRPDEQPAPVATGVLAGSHTDD